MYRELAEEIGLSHRDVELIGETHDWLRYRLPNPPDVPRMYGSASGLRSSTCIMTPASANPAPVPNAVNARGRRSLSTISRVASSPACSWIRGHFSARSAAR